ncbi:MAG: energy transducer TonB [Verrucomicrobia bacterium]|nr:energy transducer TonB [Verrucomicrobiota bacterium]
MFSKTEKRKLEVLYCLRLTSTGTIDSVEIVHGTSDERFDAAVQSWAKQWICTPRVEHGKPCWSSFSVPFKIDYPEK